MVALAAAATTAGATTRPTAALPGVVGILVTAGGRPDVWAASGIVLTSSGEVLTTNDVIRGASSIEVEDADNGRSYRAAVLGYDVTADVALLRLRGAAGLATARLGNSANVQAGQAVTAYANLGIRGAPLVSAEGRISIPHQNFVEQDMDGSPGLELTDLLSDDTPAEAEFVGGPLVDPAGRVIGVNVLGEAAEGTTSIGLSGAIPVDRARSIAKTIAAGRSSARIHVGPTAMLGVTLERGDLYEGLTTGVTVLAVIPGSPLANAGVAPGAIIQSFDGHQVQATSNLINLLLSVRPGQRATIAWVGVAGGLHQAAVRLAVGPPQ
jgi:S1-C subfamily serine protease